MAIFLTSIFIPTLPVGLLEAKMPIMWIKRCGAERMYGRKKKEPRGTPKKAPSWVRKEGEFEAVRRGEGEGRNRSTKNVVMCKARVFSRLGTRCSPLRRSLDSSFGPCSLVLPLKVCFGRIFAEKKEQRARSVWAHCWGGRKLACMFPRPWASPQRGVAANGCLPRGLISTFWRIV